MAADPAHFPIGTDHHGHGIPANDRFDTSLDLSIARENRLLLPGDRVDIRGISGKRDADALLLRTHLQQAKQLTHPLLPLGLQDIVERLAPLGVFDIMQGFYYFALIGGHGLRLLSTTKAPPKGAIDKATAQNDKPHLKCT